MSVREGGNDQWKGSLESTKSELVHTSLNVCRCLDKACVRTVLQVTTIAVRMSLQLDIQ